MASNKLRILCFGNSLTAGYSSFGSIYHPYQERLVELLQAALPDLDVEADVDGLPGGITGAYMTRLASYFGPGRPRYDWIVMLGGTNDLAFNTPAETVFENLSRCWDVAAAHGTKVLALTVPEAGVQGVAMQRISEQRNKLNELIKNAQGGNIFVHDHHAAVPFWAMSEEDRKLHWDDPIHLTPAGYDLMGEKIAARFLKVLGQEKAATAMPGGSQTAKTSGEGAKPAVAGPSRPARSKVFRDDDLVFDEETGDSTRLGQGYVVVRKKDLD